MYDRTRNKSALAVGLLVVMSLLLAACAPMPPAAAPATEAPAAEAPAAAATEAPAEAPAAEPTAPPAEAPAAEATAAPAEESAAPAAAGETSPFEGVTWQVTGYLDSAGAAATPVADATITFQNGRVSGNAGCNGFFAAYTLDGAQLSIEQGGSTVMACEEPVMAQEEAILAALGEAAAYEIADGQLTILDGAGAARLTLTPQMATTLTGVVWRATNYYNGREAVVGMLEGTEITAIFGDDGSLSGSAGCNNYITGYTVDGNQIAIQPAATTMMFCAEPEGIMEQEAAYLAALATAATYSISGQVLEMRTADDAMALRYEVATESVVAAPAAASADPDPVAAAAKAAPVEVPAAPAQTPSGRVTAQLGVNVRVGPGTQFPIVGIAPLGTEGEIVGKSADGQWWAARVPAAPNEQGWVASAYVDASNADDVPVLPAPPLPKVTAALQEGTPYVVPQNVILYSASRRVLEGNRAYELEDVYAVPATPGSQAEMVANDAMQPALSPDRKTLAVHSTQSDMLGLGGFDVDTGQRLRFSRFIEDSSPRWSPTGDRIVFASNRQGDRRWRIYITDAVPQENPANMAYTELEFGKDPDWHPSQELLILKGCDAQGQNCGTYTMNTDGSGRTQFTNEASDSMPRWFPDGSAVVFMSEGRDGNWELYRANVADGSVTRLTDDPAPDGLPAVSPDGQQIAFISKRGGAWGLWVMPAAGGPATQIASIAGELPDWLLHSVDWPR
jgi:heat shock protein HslJ